MDHREFEAGRVLDPLETYFWLGNQGSPKHFVMAAEIGGVTSHKMWRVALDAVQMRHSLLRAGVYMNDAGYPQFRLRPDRRIALRYVRDPDTPLQDLLEQELAAPFVLDDIPLVRATLAQRAQSATIILTVHHAIGDGVSTIFLIRDLLRSLAEQPAEQLFTSDESDDQPVRLRDHKGRKVRVETRALPADLGGTIREKARINGATVQGMLTAAAVLEARHRVPDWCGMPLRVMSPINTRDITGHKEEFRLSISTYMSQFEPNFPGSFWPLARLETENSIRARTPSEIASSSERLAGFIAGRPSVADVESLERQDFGREIMISNIGLIPFDPQIGRLRLEALWASAIHTSFDREQIIGVATIGTTIHLINTSYNPIPGLLEGIEQRLRQEMQAP